MPVGSKYVFRIQKYVNLTFDIEYSDTFLHHYIDLVVQIDI